jgi:hypothetical protein
MTLEEIKQKFAKRKLSLVSSKVLKEVISKFEERDLQKLSMLILSTLEFDLRQFDRANFDDVILLQAFKDFVEEICTSKPISDEQCLVRNEAQCITACNEMKPEERNCQALMGYFLKRYRDRYEKSYQYRAIRSFWTSRDMKNMSDVVKRLGPLSTSYLDWCFTVKEPRWVGGFYDTNIFASSSMMNEFEHTTILAKKEAPKSKQLLDSSFLSFVQSLDKRFSHIQSVKDLEWLLSLEQTPDIFDEIVAIQILREARKRGILPRLSTPPEKWADARKQAFLRGEYE